MNLSQLLNVFMAMRGNVLDFFKSYLSNRRKVVRVGNNTSQEMIIKYGVAQGTVIGPFLFILYIDSPFSL